MALEKRGGHLVIHFALDRPAHDFGLVLSGGENGDLAGLEDRGHTHCDGLAWDVFVSKEIGCRVLPGHEIQRDQAGPALEAGARLVESDVAGAPDAENLEVDAARGPNRLLVAPAFLFDQFARSVAPGEVHVGRRDVEMGEEVLPHEPMVGMQAFRAHRVVLVEVERHDVAEAEALVPVEPDQLAVHTDWCRTGSETQHGVPALARPGGDQVRDPAGHHPAEVVVIFDDDGRDLLLCGHGIRSQGRRPRRRSQPGRPRGGRS